MDLRLSQASSAHVFWSTRGLYRTCLLQKGDGPTGKIVFSSLYNPSTNAQTEDMQ